MLTQFRYALVAFFLSILTAVAAQPYETRVFVLNARSAESALDLVRPLLSPVGIVLAESRMNTLIVKDTGEVLLTVEKLIKEIDQHLPQVRIHVATNGIEASEGSLLEVGVKSDGRGVHGQGTAVSSQTIHSVTSQNHLLVMSGERGILHFAQDIVNPNRYVQYAVSRGVLPLDFAVQHVSTGFLVEPVVVGDVVRVRVTPWMSFANDGGTQETIFEQAATQHAVPSGQQIVIAQAGYQSDLKNELYTLIFQSARRTQSGSVKVVLRPEILHY